MTPSAPTTPLVARPRRKRYPGRESGLQMRTHHALSIDLSGAPTLATSMGRLRPPRALRRLLPLRVLKRYEWRRLHQYRVLEPTHHPTHGVEQQRH